MKHNMRLVIGGLAFALAAWLMLSGTAGHAQPSGMETLDPVTVEELWKAHCASCHGADGRGKTKAGRMKKVKDLTDPELCAKHDRERMKKVIDEGIVDPESGKERMKPYASELSEAERQALLEHTFAFCPK